MITVKRKLAFNFNPVAEFETHEEAVNYCEGIIRRTIKKNARAAKDNRPNAYGAETLPWFLINDELYNSPNDNRIINK